MNASLSYRQVIDRHIKKLFNKLLSLKKCLNPDRLHFFFYQQRVGISLDKPMVTKILFSKWNVVISLNVLKAVDCISTLL
jgi:hypothetical protein